MLTITAILVAAAVFIVARFMFRMLAGIVAALCAAAAGLFLFPDLQAPLLAWLLHGLASSAGLS
jgi:hypothetical protein